MPDDKKPQIEQFKKAARELECDEDEDRFNETLKRIVPKTGVPKTEQS